jgi:hypothetical protein
MLNHLPSPLAPTIPPSWVGKGEAQDKPKSEPKPKKQPKSAPGTIDDLDF